MARPVDKNDVQIATGDRVSIECIIDEIMPERGRARVRFGWHTLHQGTGTQNPSPSADVRLEVAFGDLKRLP